MTTPTGSPSTFAGFGKLEYAPANAPDDPFPTYVDITQYLRTEDTPLSITRGRQTELDTIQPSQLTCILDNTDGRFTFGSTTGPYGANWTMGKKIRYSEIANGQTFVLFTGYIEAPDVDSWQPIGYQEVNLSCTDRLTRLGRGAPFLSTLGAHILFNARNGALKGYWPMNSLSLPFPDITGQQPPLAPDPSVASSLVAPQFASQKIGRGDDLPTVSFGYDPVNNPLGTSLLSTLAGGGIPLLAGQVMTIVAWLAPNFPDLTNSGALASTLPVLVTTVETPAVSGAFVGWTGAAYADGSKLTGAAVSTNLHFGPSSGSTLPLIANGWALPVMVQYGWSPSVGLAMISGSDLGPYSFLGSNPTTMTLSTMRAPMRDWAGGIAHVQLYVGAPGDFTVADYLAQARMGQLGLEYQTTGQRINTILDYAGVPGDQRLVDPGVSYMQKATLAGQDPGTALANAVAAERGRGFISGDGKYVFHDRTRIYNV